MMNPFMFQILLFIIGFIAPIAWLVQGMLLLWKPEHVGEGRRIAWAGVVLWLVRTILVLTILT